MGSGSIHNTHGPINWFSQTLPYRQLLDSLEEVQQMEFQTFLTLHSVYHSFRHCQLTFFKFSSMKYFRRSLFNYFTTLPKNVNTKNKKTVTFFCDGWYCFEVDQIWVYTISPPTHSQFVNVSQRLICVYCTLIMLIYIINYQKHQFLLLKFFTTLYKQYKQYVHNNVNPHIMMLHPTVTTHPIIHNCSWFNENIYIIYTTQHMQSPYKKIPPQPNCQICQKSAKNTPQKHPFIPLFNNKRKCTYASFPK